VSFGAVNYVVLAGYLLALVAVGVYFSRREKSTDDYFLAGRRIPWWAAGLSIFGGGLSAMTYMAVPGKAFKTDWVMILTYIVPVAFIPIVTAYYIPFYRRLRVRTAYQYLERRFSLAVRWLASAYYIIFQFGRMTLLLYLPAIALATVTGLNLYACILVMGVLATVYTFLGGIEAVIWTDVLQVVVLAGGAIVTLCIIAGRVDGGIGGIIAAGRAHGKFHTFTWTWDYTVGAVWAMILGSLCAAVMPNTADQAVVQRYLVTPDERSAKRAAWTSALLGIPTGSLFFFLGTALFVFYQAQPGQLPAGLKKDTILPWFIMQQMPPGLSGLVVAGIFAAAMSSLDNGMNAVAATVTTDFYRRLRPGADERHHLRIAKGVTLVAGVVATALACVLAEQQFDALDAFFTILGFFGGGLAGMFILGIFTRRATGTGALVGAVVSAGVVCATWRYTDTYFIHYAGIGLAVCVGVGYLFSAVLPTGRTDLTGLTVYTMPPEDSPVASPDDGAE